MPYDVNCKEIFHYFKHQLSKITLIIDPCSEGQHSCSLIFASIAITCFNYKPQRTQNKVY